MAMKRVAISAVKALENSASSILTRQLHASGGNKKIVGVFYKANEYAAMNPNFVGCVEGALGIRDWLESKGHQYIVTDDKEGPDCELEKHIPDLHVLISTPFHPAYVTAERIKKAKNLQLLLTAGIGSDHIDLKAAADAGLTVAEVTGSNTVSVAEDELMRILILLRNFLPGYHQVIQGEWNVAGISYRAYDLEGKTVGTVGAGRIGRLLLQRLKPFNCNLLYHDRVKMDPELESQIGAKFEEDLDTMLPKCDIIVINTPLTEKTKAMFNKEKIAMLKKGVLIVNNARGAIMDTQAVADACSSGHIAGYSGDVWFPQPAPKDHPWRYMPNHAMTPHISGTTIDAQGTPFLAGLAVAAAALAGRYGIQAWQSFKARPLKPKLRKFYEGGFQPTMTKREAALILGVRENAPADKIKEAHRRVMVANHPDAGGSHYLASKINEAKDMMLGKTKGSGSAF